MSELEYYKSLAKVRLESIEELKIKLEKARGKIENLNNLLATSNIKYGINN